MLQHLLQTTLEKAPNRQLIDFYDRQYSADELEKASLKLVSRFKLAGLESIDRVAMLLPNCPEAVQVYLACFKGGFVVVPLDYRHRAPQIRYALNHSGADVLIVHHDRVAELESEGCLVGLSHVVIVGGEPETDSHQSFEDFVSKGSAADFQGEYYDDDLCVMIYTSGTTSRPKGVTLTRIFH